MIKKFEQFIIDEDMTYPKVSDDPSNFTAENGPYILRLIFYQLEGGETKGVRSIYFDDNMQVRSLLKSAEVVIETANNHDKSVITGIDIDNDNFRGCVFHNEMLVYPFADNEDVEKFLKYIPKDFGKKDVIMTLCNHEILSTKKIDWKYRFKTTKYSKKEGELEKDGLEYLMDLFSKNKGRTKLIE